MKPSAFPTFNKPKTKAKPVLVEATEERLPAVVSKKTFSVASKKTVNETVDPDTGEIEKVLKSRFGKSSDTIIELLEFGNDDGAIALLLKSLMQTLVDVLPTLEHAVRNSNGRYGTYQFNQTISQVRELLADIQATKDKGMLGQSIVSRHVLPAFLEIAVQVVVTLANIETAAKSRMSKEDFASFRGVVEDSKKGLATYIDTQHRAVSDAVVRSLS